MEIEYKSKKLIIEVLKNTLETSKKSVVSMQTDAGCSAQTYEEALDKCNELEYTIQQLEKQND
jgi:hypothetical protein